MSERPPRASERAASLEAERQRLAEEAKKRADDAAIALLRGLDPDADEDTAIRNMKDLLSDDQRAELAKVYGPPEMVTKPPVTRPTPEALKESRQEPTPPPPAKTLPSPPPRMTPPRGGIPIPSTALESGMPRPIEPVPFPPRPGPGSAPKILVVDDDKDILDALTTTLAEEGYGVVVAHDGIEAMKRLYQVRRCDLILLDIKLPRLPAAEFLEIFDASPFCDIPVVLISAQTRPDRGLIHDDRYVFLPKPLDLEQLLTTVHNRISEGRGYAHPHRR